MPGNLPGWVTTSLWRGFLSNIGCWGVQLQKGAFIRNRKPILYRLSDKSITSCKKSTFKVMYEVPVYWSQVGEYWWGINQYHSIKKAPLLIICQTQQCEFSTCKSIQRSTQCGWVIMNYGRAFNRAAKLIKDEVYLKPENQSKKKFVATVWLMHLSSPGHSSGDFTV